MANENEKTFLEGKYLLSANSEKGFYGFFDKVFSPLALDKLYIIHGGPGTGKSSAMKKIMSAFVKTGARAQAIYCSSDPDSLDGVLLYQNGKTVGIVDGTAPHARIAALPGLRDEEWDFSRHLCREGLTRWEKQILLLQEKKHLAYQKSYALLSPAGACHREELRSRLSAFALTNAREHARRLLKRVSSEKKSRLYLNESRFLRAFSMKGERALTAWCNANTEIVCLRGDECAAELYISALKEEAAKNGLPTVSICSPLCTDLSDGVYLPSLSLAILKQGLADSASTDKSIYVSRFVRAEERNGSKNLERIEARLVQEAMGALAEAAIMHFELEKIYSSQMDFSALEEETEKKITEIGNFFKKLPKRLPSLSQLAFSLASALTFASFNVILKRCCDTKYRNTLRFNYQSAETTFSVSSAMMSSSLVGIR